MSIETSEVNENQDLQDQPKNLANEFIQRFIRLQLDKKKIDADSKYLKQEYDEQGLPTRDVLRAYRLIKQEKKDVARADQVETFKTWLEENSATQDLISQVNSKD